MTKYIFIAVMGVTGSGKSTFISHCTQEPVEIGHNLRACTQQVKLYDCPISPDLNVKLVDTPGFDDTSRSDTEVLREIAAWLTALYASQIRVRGIIYLHRISDRRMPGSGRRNLFMFKQLCGPDALKHVILATTMWEQVDLQETLTREGELRRTSDFRGYMIGKRSTVERHTNDRESAIRLISLYLESSSNDAGFVVDLQRQMVDQGMSLNQTAAGVELQTELSHQKERILRG